MKTTLDIVPTPLIERDETIGIEKMSITYCQFDDNNHAEDRFSTQSITIETEDTIVSEDEARKDGGFYFVIKTDRWAIDPDNIGRLSDLLADFKNRLMCGVLAEAPDYGYDSKRKIDYGSTGRENKEEGEKAET